MPSRHTESHVRIIGHAILLAFLVPSLAGAQVTAPYPAGTIVRLSWKTAEVEAARLLAPLDSTTDTLRFCRYPAMACLATMPQDTIHRSLADLRSLEVRRGNQARRGMVIGAAAGASATLLLITTTAEQQPAGQSGRAVATVLIYGAIWGAIGALVGSGFDRWIPAQ